MQASNYLEEAILNHFFRNGNITSPSQLYLALYKSDPTDADTGLEVSGGNYARQPIAFSGITQIGGKATVANTSEIRFPTATSNWGTVTHFGIRTAITGGNLLAHATVPSPKPVEIGDEAKFIAGAVTVSID